MAELAKADLDSTPSLQQWACKHQQRPCVLGWCTHASWCDCWPCPRTDPCLLCPPQSASVPQIPRLISFMSSALKALWHCRTLEDQALYSAVPRRKIATFHIQDTKPPQPSLYLLCIHFITYTASGSPNFFIQPGHYLNHLLYTFQGLWCLHHAWLATSVTLELFSGCVPSWHVDA